MRKNYRPSIRIKKMLSPYINSGFYKAPVSKVLVGSSLLNYLLLTFPLHQYKPLFVYSPASVFERRQIWRVLASKLVFLEIKDVMLGSLLLYYFRIFERRYGSKKFCSYILGNGVLVTAFELSILGLCRLADLDIEGLPTGPFCIVYPLFVPFFCDIPRVALTHLWGIPITGKSFTYILGLQMASGSLESCLAAACSLFVGLLYRMNFLQVQTLIRIPDWLSNCVSRTVGKLLESSPPRQSNFPNGATLELQRQQQIEQLEQQLTWAQATGQSPWRFNFGQQNYAPGADLFANHNTENGLRQRLNHEMPSASGLNPTPVPEEQVTRLIEMGFNRDKVMRALQVTNNDITMATNILLQEL